MILLIMRNKAILFSKGRADGVVLTFTTVPLMSQQVRVFHVMLFDMSVQNLGSVEELAAEVATKLFVGKLDVALKVGPRTKLFVAALTTTVIGIVVETNRG